FFERGLHGIEECLRTGAENGAFALSCRWWPDEHGTVQIAHAFCVESRRAFSGERRLRGGVIDDHDIRAEVGSQLCDHLVHDGVILENEVYALRTCDRVGRRCGELCTEPLECACLVSGAIPDGDRVAASERRLDECATEQACAEVCDV